MTEKLGVNEKEPAFGQKTPTTMCRKVNNSNIAQTTKDMLTL